MAVRTDRGRVRLHNEDAVCADASAGLAILADGMGGHHAGDVASAMAVSQLAAELGHRATAGLAAPSEVARHIADAVAAANTAIRDAGRREQAYAGMGTTLVMACFHDDRMSVAHVGDSRLYRLRGAAFEQLTRDHSLVQELRDNVGGIADEAELSRYRSFVTRALGGAPHVDVEINDYDMASGDILLLCSDGLTDMLDDAMIADVLWGSESIEAAADALLQMANDAGGQDNISVILVRVAGVSATSEGA